VRSPASLFRGEQPSHGGLHSENLEEVSNDFHARGRLGLAAAGDSQIVRSIECHVSGHVLIGAALLAEFFVGVSRVSGARESAVSGRRSNPHELTGLEKWQRSQQQCVDHAEDPDVRTDGKGEDEDRDERESTIAAQRPESIFQVLREDIEFHGCPARGFGSLSDVESYAAPTARY